MTPTRNICLGTVYRDGLLVELGQLRSRKCLSVNWRGRTSVFQPFQFLEERQLLEAVRGRLAMAGLSLLQWEIKREPGRGDYEPIRCVVGRLHRPHLRAVHENRMVQGWKLVKEIHDAPATMTEDEMQAAMAEVAMAFGRKETL
jgi:hypothetical protein